MREPGGADLVEQEPSGDHPGGVLGHRQRPALVRVGVERVGAVGVEDREQRLGDVFEVAGRELLGLLGEELGDLGALLVLQVGRDTPQGADGDVQVLAGDPAVGQRLPELVQLPAGAVARAAATSRPDPACWCRSRSHSAVDLAPTSVATLRSSTAPSARR